MFVLRSLSPNKFTLRFIVKIRIDYKKLFFRRNIVRIMSLKCTGMASECGETLSTSGADEYGAESSFERVGWAFGHELPPLPLAKILRVPW